MSIFEQFLSKKTNQNFHFGSRVASICKSNQKDARQMNI